jgi:hypothetical protein
MVIATRVTVNERRRVLRRNAMNGAQVPLTFMAATSNRAGQAARHYCAIRTAIWAARRALAM